MFARNIFYVRGDLDTPEDYGCLRQRLEELEAGDGAGHESAASMKASTAEPPAKSR
jgi:hypothetical protein